MIDTIIWYDDDGNLRRKGELAFSTIPPTITTLNKCFSMERRKSAAEWQLRYAPRDPGCVPIFHNSGIPESADTSIGNPPVMERTKSVKVDPYMAGRACRAAWKWVAWKWQEITIVTCCVVLAILLVPVAWKEVR